MKITNSSLITVILGMTVFTGNIFAYDPSETDRDCKKPRFRTFEPEHLSEVDPETEISFHVSNWANPNSIKAEARKIPMKVSFVDKINFFVATARLPASISGRYARISLSAKAKEGGCRGLDGWLLKVRKAEDVTALPEKSEEEKAAEGKIEK